MKRFTWRDWPLTAQITLAMAILAVGAVIGVTLIYTDRARSNSQLEIEKQATVILVTIENVAANSLYILDTSSLETAMESLGDAEAGILAQIYDFEGRLVADSGKENSLVFNLDPDPLGRELINQEKITFHRTSEYLEAGKQVTVGREVIGAISVRLSTQTLEANIQETTRQGLLIALIFGLIGTGLSLLISRTVTRPLHNITTTAQQITEGDLSQRLPVEGSLELKSLAIAFNDMTNHLQETIQQLSSINAKIEKNNAELAIARDQALVASRLKDEFLSTMSHELRTPMNAIEGFTSIMLSRMGGVEYNAKAERYLTRIDSNSKRLLQLINDFLDLSRVESGRLEFANLPFSPSELAHRWENEIGGLAEKKSVALDVAVDPKLPDTIYGDEEAISKVALNLLSNAIKFTEEGKVSLCIQNGGQQWSIIVSDTGIGIPPHAKEYIFEEFRQVDQTSKRKYGGTGLGLAIVQKYVRVMGGTVSVQSELGQGSTFTVTLPLHVET
jgi:two-component system, NarL family, sensor histidine kinase BarA